PKNRMGARGTLLDPADVERSGPELYLLPPQVRQFGSPQAMPIGHKDHRGVPVAPTVSFGRPHQPLDLGFGQVLAGAQVTIGGPFGPDCSVYGRWRDQPEVPSGHAFCAPCPNDCLDNALFMNSVNHNQGDTWPHGGISKERIKAPSAMPPLRPHWASVRNQM